MRRWGKPKHKHDWQVVGYGGAGWTLLRCTLEGCEEKESTDD